MGGTQTPLSSTETMLLGLVVSIAVIPPTTWRLVQHFQVMAHEGMHGVIGSLSGTVEWIELRQTAEGGTRVVPSSGTGFAVAAFAGYLGPSAFGLGAARLIQFGHIIAVLWVTVLLLALLLIMLKPSFGYVTVPLAGALIFLILKHMPQTAQIAQRSADAGDAHILRGLTSVPRLVWHAGRRGDRLPLDAPLGGPSAAQPTYGQGIAQLTIPPPLRTCLSSRLALWGPWRLDG